MIGRWLRVACLAMAAWALLFAPGAAGAEPAGASDASRGDRVAAAVLAPTFESDSVARSPRPCTSSVEDGAPSRHAVVGHLPPDGAAPVCGTATDVGPGPRHPAERRAPTFVSLRAPPAS